MRLALAMMFQNEEKWLRLHLPHIVDQFDGIVAVDGGSKDGGAEYMRSLGAYVVKNEFAGNFGAQAQILVDTAESLDYDAILRLDPDETMRPEDVHLVRLTLMKGLDLGIRQLISLPRINFVKDRVHVSDKIDPDPQWRAWHLKAGIRYHEVRVHETPNIEGTAVQTMHVNAPIWHYGFIKSIASVNKKFRTYKALEGDSEAAKSMKDFYEWEGIYRYRMPQPVDPDVCGYGAPIRMAKHSFRLNKNLEGDRQIEYGFAASQIPYGKGKALDVGSGGSNRPAIDFMKNGWSVTTVDPDKPYAQRGILSVRGTLDDVKDSEFDIVSAISVVEHAGLVGRYGVSKSEEDADVELMAKIREKLKAGGILILTVPVGKDYVHKPMHRVYGHRLDKLIEGFEFLTAQFWMKQDGWKQVSMDEAFTCTSVSVSDEDWAGCFYAIGCFVLRKDSE